MSNDGTYGARSATVEASPYETLSAFVDEELSPSDHARVVSLIERSDRWRQKAEEFRAVDNLLRDWAAAANTDTIERLLSPDLLDEHAFDDEEDAPVAVAAPQASPPARRGRVRAVLLSAAAAVLAVGAFAAALMVGGGHGATAQPDYNTMLAAMVEDHTNFARMERPYEVASQDPSQLADWLLATRGLTDPDATDWASTNLVGASRCTLLQTPTAVTFLEDDAGLISVFAIERDRLSGDDAPARGLGMPGDCCEYTENTAVCVWGSGDWLFVSVSNRSESALRESLMLAATEP